MQIGPMRMTFQLCPHSVSCIDLLNVSQYLIGMMVIRRLVPIFHVVCMT